MKTRQVWVLALAGLLSASSVWGANWFDAGIEGYTDWPMDGSVKVMPGVGFWQNTASGELGGEAGAHTILVESGEANPLEFVAAQPKSPTEGELAVDISISFTAGSQLPVPDQTMKGAVTVVDDEDGTSVAYYGLAKDPAGATNIWHRLSGASPVIGSPVALTLAFREENGQRYVRYAVNDVALSTASGEWLPIIFPAGSKNVAVVGCLGTGEIRSLSGVTAAEVPNVTLTIPEIEGMSVASVKVSGREIRPEADGTYLIAQGALVSVVFIPAAGTYLDRSTMVFAINEDMVLPDEGRPTVVEAKDILTINEFMASNGSAFHTANGAWLDWIEIRNSSDYDVDISGWYLFDDSSKKKSKWEQIQGPCVVPANGYAVVWADKDYIGFTANEAFTRIGLSADGEELFLANPEGEIADQFTFGKQIKDVSCGRGRINHIVLDANSSAEWRVGDGAWNAVALSVGMGAAETGFTVVTYPINGQISDINAAESFLADPAKWKSAPVTNIAATINFVGADGGTQSGCSYGSFPGGMGDDYLVEVTGAIVIPEGGLWTFSCGSDDGFAATISRLGESWSWEYEMPRSHAEDNITLSLPAAGTYQVRILYYNRSGGATLDFFVAKGEKDWTNDAADFKLVGSSASGVLHGSMLAANSATDVSAAMRNQAASLDWRSTFTREGPVGSDLYRLRIRYADGFTAKLNGTLFAQVSGAVRRSPADALEYAYFDIPSSLVRAGENLLEITGVNNSADDGDFFLSPEVLCSTVSRELVYFPAHAITPGAANAQEGKKGPTPEVVFSVPHGWKTQAFTVELSCPSDPEAVIYYTTDGTSPTTSSIHYTGPISIDRTTCLRAAVPNADSLLQMDSSATYLFARDVITQSGVPTGFPGDKAVNNQVMKYGMNPSITSAYRSNVLNGLTNGIPTLSIVTDLKNLFDKSNGIYVNASGNGRTWERSIMLEQISPTNTAHEFSLPAGIRIRGAYSRDSACPKHSFRFFFRNEYGASKLNFKLFDDEGADSFDKVDLRTAQNYSWANGNDQFTFIEELWSRDSQRDLGQSYHRTRFYNLFINGIYWGVYQTEERTCGEFGESYFGGTADDYDVVRTSQPGYVTGVVEGDPAGWRNFWNLSVNQGYGGAYSNNYKKAMGLNSDGRRNPAYPIYLNPTNVFLYMLTAHYASDADSPSASDSRMANNNAQLWNRHSGTNTLNGVKQTGWIFHRHDAEHSLGTSDGVSANNILRGTHVQNGNMAKAENFCPSELNFKLMENAEYKMLAADLFFKHCLKEGGAMTAAEGEKRFRKRMDEFGDAVACEAARWGGGCTPATWTNACNNRISFINDRPPYLLQHYRSQGWYPSIDAPRVTVANGVHVLDGQVLSDGDELYLSSPSAGAIYYTLDGTDPRLEGGEVKADALTFTGTAPEVVYRTAFSKKSLWQYYDWGNQPDVDSAGRAWYAKDYVNTNSWGAGNGILGFNGTTATETIGTTLHKYSNHVSSETQVYTYYFRKTFTLPAEAATSVSVRINVLYDDCYAIYINGTEVDRLHLAKNATYSTFADGGSAHKEEISRVVTIPAGLLCAGANTIAVELHQNQSQSSDIYFDLGLDYATYGNGTGAIIVPATGLQIRARQRSVTGEWSALESVDLASAVAPVKSPLKAGLRFAEVMSCSADEDAAGSAGDGSEFIVFTNLLSDATLDLSGVRLTCTKTGNDAPSLDAAGSSLLTGHVETSWFNAACDGTGASFLAVDLARNVTTEAQWKPSFIPPTDSTGAKGVRKAIAKDDSIRVWLNALSQTDAGQKAITTFGGDKDVLRACYLVNALPETTPAIAIDIPTIVVNADGTIAIGGRLFQHGQEAARTVNGEIRLYHAPTLEDLPHATESLPFGHVFPITPQPFAARASRFFQLRVE